MSIGKTLVTVILTAHLLSCLWFWVNCFEALDNVSAPSGLLRRFRTLKKENYLDW